MTSRRPGQEQSLQRALGSDTATSSVRPSDLIRPPQDRETGWTVFVDVDDERQAPRRRAPRDTFTRRRPIEWKLEEDDSESNKENIGQIVRRPKRRRVIPQIPLDTDSDNQDSRSNVSSSPTAPSSPTTTTDSTTPPSAKSKGKRKLQTPPAKEVKAAEKHKKPKIEVVRVRVEPVQVAIEAAVEPTRRPLEDITHLFIDPTAFYFRPWQRASRLAMRPSSLRTL